MKREDLAIYAEYRSILLDLTAQLFPKENRFAARLSESMMADINKWYGISLERSEEKNESRWQQKRIVLVKVSGKIVKSFESLQAHSNVDFSYVLAKIYYLKLAIISREWVLANLPVLEVEEDLKNENIL